MAGGVPARRDRPHARVPRPADHTRIPPDDDRAGLDWTATRAPAPPAHDSIHIAGAPRPPRQRPRPNDSIESDPAVHVSGRRVRRRAGSLPIESYRFPDRVLSFIARKQRRLTGDAHHERRFRVHSRVRRPILLSTAWGVVHARGSSGTPTSRRPRCSTPRCSQPGSLPPGCQSWIGLPSGSDSLAKRPFG